MVVWNFKLKCRGKMRVTTSRVHGRIELESSRLRKDLHFVALMGTVDRAKYDTLVLKKGSKTDYPLSDGRF